MYIYIIYALVKSKRKKTRKQLLIKCIDYLNHLLQDFLFLGLYFFSPFYPHSSFGQVGFLSFFIFQVRSNVTSFLGTRNLNTCMLSTFVKLRKEFGESLLRDCCFLFSVMWID